MEFCFVSIARACEIKVNKMYLLRLKSIENRLKLPFTNSDKRKTNVICTFSVLCRRSNEKVNGNRPENAQNSFDIAVNYSNWICDKRNDRRVEFVLSHFRCNVQLTDFSIDFDIFIAQKFQHRRDIFESFFVCRWFSIDFGKFL